MRGATLSLLVRLVPVHPDRGNRDTPGDADRADGWRSAWLARPRPYVNILTMTSSLRYTKGRLACAYGVLVYRVLLACDTPYDDQYTSTGSGAGGYV